MVVRCITNELAKIESNSVRIRLGKAIQRDGPNRNITVGQDYYVHAVEYRDGGYWYFILSVAQNDYPYPFPAEYFEVTDATIPAGWSVKFTQNGDGTKLKRLSFCEWAKDDSFYERLVDGDIAAIEVFRQHMTVS